MTAKVKIDKTIGLLTLIFVLSISAILWYVSLLRTELLRSHALDTARQITLVLREVRALYTSDVVAPAAAHGMIITHDTTAIKNSIPLPATFSMRLGELIGRQSGGVESKLYSPWPFPLRINTGGLRDVFAANAWKALNINKDQPYTQFIETDAGMVLRYAVADQMKTACVSCHNAYPQSPKTDWKVGDIRGVLEVTVPLAAIENKAKDQERETLIIFSGVGFLFLFGLIITFRKLSISNAILEVRTSELEHANNRLKELSEIDPLTNVHNRRYYESQLSVDIAMNKRSMSSLSLLLIDVDHFKKYNDNYGHDKGDAALRSVAGVIDSSLSRATDWVARYGGEEFAVILSSTDLAGAYQVAEHIRESVANLKIPHHYSSSATVITVSIGIASLTGAQLTAAALFQQADLALYNAKVSGRNQCKNFHAELLMRSP